MFIVIKVVCFCNGLGCITWIFSYNKWLYCYRTFAMDQAAANGHFDIMRWLHKYRSEGCNELGYNKWASFYSEMVTFSFIRRLY